MTMAEERNNEGGNDRSGLGEDVDRRLDDAADAATRPHEDAEERRRQREAADRAERSPRRQGEGIHPGSH
jgi:hypothetical protein